MLRFNDEAGTGEGGGEDGGQDSLLNGGGSAGGSAGAEGNPPALPEGTFLLKDFKAALPEEMRKNEGLGKINTLEDMTRSYLAAQRMIGRDPASLIELPKPDAKLEERLAVLGKLGAPEKEDGYKLALPEGTPEALTKALAMDTDLGKAVLAAAVQTKMLPEQLQAVYGVMGKFLGEAMTQMSTQTETDHATNINTLKTEAGGAFDDWVNAATFGIQKVGGNELRDILNGAGLGTNPTVVKAFVQVGKLLAEDSAGGTGGTGGGRFGALAPAEAKARANELLAKSHKETNATERKRLQQEAHKYFAIAAGEK